MKSMFLAILFVLTALLGCAVTPAPAPAVAPDTLIYADDDGVDIGSSRPFPGGEKLYQKEEWGMRVRYHQGFEKLPKTWPPSARIVIMPDTPAWCAQELRLFTRGVADLKYDEVDQVALALPSMTPKDREGIKRALDPARYATEIKTMEAENNRVRQAEERARKSVSKSEIKTLIAVSGINMEDPGFIKVASSESFPGCKEHTFSDRKLYDLEIKHSRAKLGSALPAFDRNTARIFAAGNVPPSLMEEVRSATGLDLLKYEEVGSVVWTRWDEREMVKCFINRARFSEDLIHNGWSREAAEKYIEKHCRPERCTPSDEPRRHPPMPPTEPAPK